MKNRGLKDGEAIEVYVYYGQESNGGSSTPLKQLFFPSFDILLDKNEEDQIRRVEMIQDASHGRLVYITSDDFRVRAMIKDNLDAEYHVRCKLIEGGNIDV